MSIVKFNTTGAAEANSGSSSSSNYLMWGILLLGVGYMAYKFWWLPKQEKKVSIDAEE